MENMGVKKDICVSHRPEPFLSILIQNNTGSIHCKNDSLSKSTKYNI